MDLVSIQNGIVFVCAGRHILRAVVILITLLRENQSTVDPVHQSARKTSLKEHGDARIPRSHVVLGGWTRVQRRMKSNGKLLQERIQILDEIGFIWDARK